MVVMADKARMDERELVICDAPVGCRRCRCVRFKAILMWQLCHFFHFPSVMVSVTSSTTVAEDHPIGVSDSGTVVAWLGCLFFSD